jgi:aspartate racemase
MNGEMLSVGIVGGMSPESTVTYYQHIVHRHTAECANHAYPRIIIASVSFQQYMDWQHAGTWDRIAAGLQKELEVLALAGASYVVLATNTMHKALPEIKSPIPVLSILDAVSRHACKEGLERLGLTGTKFTMSDGFYSQGLEKRGLGVVLPSTEEQEAINKIIYYELIQGIVNPSSVQQFAEIVGKLADRGAEAVLLGCTELELLTRERSLPAQTLDSTRIHADAAWEVAVGRVSLAEFDNAGAA